MLIKKKTKERRRKKWNLGEQRCPLPIEKNLKLPKCYTLRSENANQKKKHTHTHNTKLIKFNQNPFQICLEEP